MGANGMIGEVVAWLARLPEPTFRILLAEVSGRDGLDGDGDRIEALASRMRLGHEATRLAVHVLAHLYGQVHRDRSPLDLLGLLTDAWPSLTPSGKGEPAMTDEAKGAAIGRLCALLERRASVDLSFRRREAAIGFVPLALAFESMLDLRPVLSDDRSRVEEFVAILQLQVTTSSREPELRNAVFHMDRTGLRRLREAVDVAERKFAALDRAPGVGDLIHPAGGRASSSPSGLGD